MSRSQLLRVLIALSAAATVAAAPARAQAAPEVVDLRFEGAESFEHRELAAAIATSETLCASVLLQPLCWAGIGLERAHLRPGALEADALRLRVYYYERGFRNVRVQPVADTVGETVRVVFRIEENQPVRVASIERTGLPPALRHHDIPLEEGQPFDLVAYEAGRDSLLSRLRDSGYAHAEVLLAYTIAREDPHAAHVRYDIVPGPSVRIGAVRIEGNEQATPELVRRMLTFESGDSYERNALLESQRNLYGLQIFRHAEIRADLETAADTLVPVTVRLAEGEMRRVRVGAGVDNIECGNVQGRWTGRNFLGGGRSLDVRARIGNLLIGHCSELLPGFTHPDPVYDTLTGLIAVDFTQPWLFGPRNTISVGLFAERRVLPDVFLRSAVGGYLSIGRSLGRDASIALAWRPELTELRTEGDLFFCVNFIACAYEDVRRLREPHALSPLALSFSVDRTDAVFAPTSGYVVRADLEHAAAYTGSDFAYTRISGEASTYAGEPQGVVVAARVRGGIGWPDQDGGGGVLRLNPQKRFFAGGPNSVRGLGQYRLGPTVLGVDAVRYLAQPDDTATARVEGAGCVAGTINDGTCNVRVLESRPGAFVVRPAGGEVLLEGNIEVRFPLPLADGKLRGAAFVDAGQVWATAADVEPGGIVVTPGVGIRYYSPIGPIRVDAGFNTLSASTLPVLTTEVEPCTAGSVGCMEIADTGTHLRNTDTLVMLDRSTLYDRYSRRADTLEGFFQRFQLHFSIGQAF